MSIIMLKVTYTPVRNKCKMLKVVYSIKKFQNKYLCYSFTGNFTGI